MPSAQDHSLILPGGKVDPDAVRFAVGDADTDSLDESEGLARVTFKLSRDLDKRLDKYLTDRIPFMSRTQLQRLIDEGGVTVNARPAKPAQKLHLHDLVEIALPPPPSTDIQPEDIPLDILYEDDYLIVINKQPGLIVHPARAHLKGTLLNALVHHFHSSPSPPPPTGEIARTDSRGSRLSSLGADFARPGVVHRLDRFTSGVMVVAKDDTAHWRLGRQFETRTVDKRYLALVEGNAEADADIIDAPLGDSTSRIKGHREKQQVRHDPAGKPALTIYRVRQRFFPFSPAPGGGDVTNLRVAEGASPRPHVPSRRPQPYSFLEIELKTGRTHQIRVHLSHVGHPLVGDDMYGGRKALFSRQALHAATLAFTHPITGAPMRFAAPLPADFRDLLNDLRATHEPTPIQSPPGSTVDLASMLTAE